MRHVTKRNVLVLTTTLHAILERLWLHSVRRSPFLTILSRKLDDDDDVMLSFYSRKSDCIVLTTVCTICSAYLAKNFPNHKCNSLM